MISEVLHGHDPWPAIFVGVPGCGKTCAMLSILDWTGGGYIERASVLGHEWADIKRRTLMERTATAIWPMTEREYMSRLAALNVVCVDELGLLSKVSDSEVEALMRLLDDRQGGGMILATNRTAEELVDIYGTPLVSRLSAGTVIPFPPVDRRRRSQKLRPAQHCGEHGAQTQTGTVAELQDEGSLPADVSPLWDET